MTEIQLNADQQNAIDQFTGFMLTDEKVFVLSGAAGTGKTTVLRQIYNNKDAIKIGSLTGRKVPRTWQFTATTNKAAEVLRMTVRGDASTIHSALGLGLKPNFKTGTEDLFRRGKDVLEDTILLIDECSMVDRQLLGFINDCTYNCKYIFVGDHCQLAPVKESLSPVFKMTEPVVLNEVMRSINAPPITALAAQLRQTVETGVFKPIHEVPGFIDYLNPEQAEEEIRNVFSDHDADARILCFTNQKVIRFNNYIRQLRKYPAEVSAGEHLVSNSMAYGFYRSGGQKVRPTVRIEEELEVLDVEYDTSYLIQQDGIKDEFPTHTIHTDQGSFLVPRSTDDYRDVLKYLSKNKKWYSYFSLKENVADLRPRDAATVYKAQGSTYHTVFIDLTDIGTCRVPSQVARMLYVACTRPTHRICFIGNLPPKYRGA